ncbi:MAG: ABC transporter ATP-binding protein [Lagierella massiliensis]|nr:ABC transporter ATP-binding protein [Lagierella massiliensis]
MSYVEMIDSVKTYQVGTNKIYANNKVTFSIEKGELAVIVGPSGAGKSTVLNILGGMDTNDSGKVIIDGKDISQFNERQLTKYRRNDVGFVFQFYNLIPNLTTKENVELASQIVSDAKDAVEVLKQVGLEHRIDNFPAQLSGGEQQRVAIARALAKKPKLLLCDEPTGALDYHTGKAVLKLLQKTCEETGTTVILITHNQAITPIANRVIEINDAKVRNTIINDKPRSIDEIEW